MIHFLGYGRICTYQFQVLSHLQAHGLTGGYYQPTTDRPVHNLDLQQLARIVPVTHGAGGLVLSGLPRFLRKPLEHMGLLVTALMHLAAGRRASRTLLLSGWLFVPLIPLARLFYHRVIFWKFGIAEEMLMADQSHYARGYFHLVRCLERCFFRYATGFLVQSESMAQYIRRDGGPEKRVYLAPCVADHRRFSWSVEGRKDARRRFGLSGRFVVTHLGSINQWQDVAGTMAVFNQIRRVKPQALLLLLTADDTAYHPWLRRYGIENCMSMHCPHEEVPRLLWASDCALLLRRRHLVVKVSTPIKFAEYVSAGLPVAISPEVGPYSEMTKRAGLGIVLDLRVSGWQEEVANWVTHLPLSSSKRSQLAEFAKRNLSFASIRTTLQGLAAHTSKQSDNRRFRSWTDRLDVK